MTPTTIPAALRAALERDPGRPLLTSIGPGGERVELSVRTFENNVAKAANLLRDDAGAGPGSIVAVDLPLHWQTAVWLGACAAVGALAWVGGDPADSTVEVSVVGPDGLDGPAAPLGLATSLHPWGMPFDRALPPGLLDAAVEVRAHGDVFTPDADVAGSAPWLRADSRGWTQDEALHAAVALADRHGLARGDRLLVPSDAEPDGLLALLALPLGIDGAVVVLRDPEADPAEVARTERCARVLA